MKVPPESSIYWDSIGSHRSTSVGSSGDAYSSGSASRHYVDPWDLENYAYLRRHSVAGLTQHQPSRHHRRPSYRLSQETRAHSEYWYSTREPGYDAPAFVEELYCGPARPGNNSCYYHQPIYEDEVPDYVAPFPVYAPLSDVRHGEFMEDHRRSRHRCKSSYVRDVHRSASVDTSLLPMDSIELDIPEYRSRQDYRPMEPEKYMVQIVPSPHLDLNTYGHLKIDYTNSWNSLNRKISK
ncbi:uncharacterized protein LOC143427325 [Xylocopa sonorina]|uniref:uncharacterized protein LOC143427325 n=1 Tax=Xylocopa sonorina TaxID=1818115 RepID=UPI00403AC030